MATSFVPVSGVQSNQYYKADLQTKHIPQQRCDRFQYVLCTRVHCFSVPERERCYVSWLRGVHVLYLIAQYFVSAFSLSAPERAGPTKLSVETWEYSDTVANENNLYRNHIR